MFLTIAILYFIIGLFMGIGLCFYIDYRFWSLQNFINYLERWFKDKIKKKIN